MTAHPIAVASNRGPVTYVQAPDGTQDERRGVGGLVTAVGGALGGHDASWICAAMSDGDRRRAGVRTELEWGDATLHVRFVDVAPERYDAYYNGFANRVLWFVNHDLWDHVPDLEQEHAASWQAYREVAELFARAILDEAGEGALALPQDYHLALVPALLRARRPDLPVALFWHTPFAEPRVFRALPDDWARAVLDGMLGADLLGFHARRWADNFRACCASVLGAHIDGDVIRHEGRRVLVTAYPLGVDVAALAASAAEPEVGERLRALNDEVGERTLILRADRTELTKNILRGLDAYAELLEHRPDLHGRVVHAAFLSPSRGEVPEYEAYMRDVRTRAEAINGRFGTNDWRPLILDVRNDFPRTLAGYRRYDVLVVNPLYDGMNLVAREGPLVNERHGVLVLSRNAGAADELGDAALVIDPFDVGDTARARARAVDMGPDERRAHAAALRAAAAGTPPDRWLAHQIRDLVRATSAPS